MRYVSVSFQRSHQHVSWFGIGNSTCPHSSHPKLKSILTSSILQRACPEFQPASEAPLSCVPYTTCAKQPLVPGNTRIAQVSYLQKKIMVGKVILGISTCSTGHPLTWNNGPNMLFARTQRLSSIYQHKNLGAPITRQRGVSIVVSATVPGARNPFADSRVMAPPASPPLGKKGGWWWELEKPAVITALQSRANFSLSLSRGPQLPTRGKKHRARECG